LHQLGHARGGASALCAVCDVDAGAAEARRREWNVSRAYTDYRDLLEDPEIDAVEILTPQPFHEQMAVDALEAGKHVAVQKPMTISLASADRMIHAAQRAGTVFKVTDNYLFYPPVMLAKKLMDEGVIGEPNMLRMKFIGGLPRGAWDVPVETWAWRLQEINEGRGIQTFDHGHHMWATAWYLMGEIERVAAWVDQTLGFIDCPAVIMWKYKAGRRYGVCDYTHAVELEIPSKYYACDEWFEITGSRGIIMVRRATGNLLDGPAVSVFTNDGWTHHDVASDWSLGFVGATENFIGAIQGKEEPLLTGEQAKEILRFAFALRRSSDERREIMLKEVQEP
jgi:predicted dehydrogenase